MELNETVSLQVKRSGVVLLPRIIDDRDGCICIAETGKNIDFEIRRVYYITSICDPDSKRGMHAHKSLRQIIFCISGSFILTLNDGDRKQDIVMWQNQLGIRLEPGLWHNMHHFSNGCVILVLANDYFCEEDYVRNYETFLELHRKGYWS